jgi:hypothetical protein
VSALLALSLLQAKTENPEYAAWARFGFESWVSMKLVAHDFGGPHETRVKRKLVERSAERCIVEETILEGDGKGEKRKIEIPRWLAKEDRPPLKAEEELEVAGKKLKCVRVAVRFPSWTETIWYSDRIPGGVARREIGGINREVAEAVDWSGR